jgi:hypothetical protein
MRLIANAVQARALASLEKGLLLRSKRLQRFLVSHHERAFRALLARLEAPPRRILIVGGGIFPRTAIILRSLLPRSELVIVDASAENVALARRVLEGTPGGDSGIRFVVGWFDPTRARGFDLVVIPLGFSGERDELYRMDAPAVFLHDWLWRARGDEGVRVSWLLLRRLNVVRERNGRSPGALVTSSSLEERRCSRVGA